MPNQFRWLPQPVEKDSTFVDGIKALAGAGDPSMKAGIHIYLYSADTSMTDRKITFCNADGDFLIVPQQNTIDIKTECGRLRVAPNEIVVIPRGHRFSVDLVEGPIKGYICEVFDGHFQIPGLGPIGANGLANPRDFQSPTAWYEHKEEKWTLIHKYINRYFYAEVPFFPYNVVAWHGNYVPFKYDLANFVAVNTVTVDHLDPSIYTVLTCQTAVAGTACCDFVIFPPRWNVANKTFRPPYFHRNCMSEFMGLVKGDYEAKKGKFLPGGGSLHSCMTPHGPDVKTFVNASNCSLEPVRVADGTMAFMFESYYMLQVSEWGAKCHDTDYNNEAWISPPNPVTFDPNNPIPVSKVPDPFKNGSNESTSSSTESSA